MVHNLKIMATFADAVLSGAKTFEIRKNDRGFQKGDDIVFSVIDNFGREIPHELNKHMFHITYVLNGWGLKRNYCVLAIHKIAGRE